MGCHTKLINGGHKNEKDIQYTRSLVNAEYMIQTEFKIDSGVGEDVIEEDTRTKDQKKSIMKVIDRNEQRLKTLTR